MIKELPKCQQGTCPQRVKIYRMGYAKLMEDLSTGSKWAFRFTASAAKSHLNRFQAEDEPTLQWNNEEKKNFLQKAQELLRYAAEVETDDQVLDGHILFAIKCPAASGAPYAIAKLRANVVKLSRLNVV
uniref:Reverse transcriptase/retrotransposon-derived protein RNase H-like domain-containing protein n=1 Tax=Trichuris muris TaxID=70415 RepID=A0A5S6QL52_TRIMR